VGVFAHEFGHVQHRHGLRTLLRTAAVSAVAAWYFGDFTSLANAAVIVSQLSYSREFETQADDTAVELMRANRLNTKSLAELFRRMRDRGEMHDHGDDAKSDAPEATSSQAKGERESTPRAPAKRVGPFSVPEFLSTHPDIEQRIERFDKAAGT
jgi:Zn-dependent protease with chaperone function